MNIRRATFADCDGINRLLFQVQQIHHIGRPDLFKGNTKKYTNHELEQIICDDKSPIFVYTNDENTVLGYAFCIFEERTENNSVTALKTLYIDDLCVDEACRRQHIGKALCDYVVEFANKNGFDNITLNVWELNGNARKFYDSYGFVPQKTCMEMVLK